MILVIDIGNTNIVLGVYQDRELIHYWRISTEKTIHRMNMRRQLRIYSVFTICLSAIYPGLLSLRLYHL